MAERRHRWRSRCPAASESRSPACSLPTSSSSGPTPTAPASQIDHTAIYLGNGWLVESAGQGVSLGRLDWYGKRFAWARRPLAEIGLEAWPQPANAV